MHQLKSNQYYEITDIELQWFLEIHFGFNFRLKDIILNCKVGNYYVFKLENSFVIPDIRENIEGFGEIIEKRLIMVSIRKELKRLKDAKELEYQPIIYLLINCNIIPHGEYVISITR